MKLCIGNSISASVRKEPFVMGAHITELGENRKKLTKLLFINAWEILAHFALQVDMLCKGAALFALIFVVH